MDVQTLMRKPAVMATLGIGRTALQDEVLAGRFPRPIKVTQKVIAWPSREVDAMVAARIAGLDNERLRALVDQMHAQRAAANPARGRKAVPA